MLNQHILRARVREYPRACTKLLQFALDDTMEAAVVGARFDDLQLEVIVHRRKTVTSGSMQDL